MRVVRFIFQEHNASAQFKCYLKSCPVEMRIYMNTTSVNVASHAPASKIIAGDNTPSSEKGEVSEDFKNALKTMKKVASARTAQVEQPRQPQSVDIPKNSNATQQDSPDQKELLALFGQYLPLSTSKNAPETVGVESASVALTAKSPNQPQNLEITNSNNTVKQDSPNQKEQVVLLEQNQPPLSTEEKTEPVGITPDEPTTTAEPSLAATDVTPTQDLSSAMAMNGLAFVKSASEEIKLDPAAHDKEIETSFQKTTFFGQSTQNALGNALPSTDSKEPEKLALTAVVESTSITELEKTAPDVRTEILGIQKPTEVKIDNFAIAKPVTHPGWSKDLGEQIVWMNNKETAAAEIKLNPIHLGPISIRIDVGQDNQTSIQFTALHTETKEALEASIPKLREMLQGQQLNLVNVNISQNTNSNNGRQSSQAFYGNPASPEASLDTGIGGLEMHEADAVVNKGLLSLYA